MELIILLLRLIIIFGTVIPGNGTNNAIGVSVKFINQNVDAQIQMELKIIQTIIK